MSQGPFGLAEHEFFSDPLKTEEELRLKLCVEGFRGVVLDAPRRVYASERFIPVVGIYAQTLRESAFLPPFRRQALLVAVDLDRRQVHVDRLLPAKARPIKRKPVLEDPGEGLRLKRFLSDAWTQLHLRKRPGRYAMWVVLREHISNLVEVEVCGDPDPYPDPAVRRFLADHRRPGYPQPVSPAPAPPPAPDEEATPDGEAAPDARVPGPRLPSYRPLEGTPPQPAEEGIDLAVERVILVEPGARCLVQASFRVSLLPREFVRPPAPGDDVIPEPPQPESDPDDVREPSGAAPPPDADDEEDDAEFEDEQEAPEEYEDLPEPPEDPLRAGKVWQDVGDPDASAVVPITLLITSAQGPSPVVIGLQVPVYEPIRPGERTPACGQFALDLLSNPIAAEAMRGKTNYIHVFAGGLHAGPFTTAIVTPEQLARG